MTGNVLIGNGNSGIHVNLSPNSTISANVCRNNTPNGIVSYTGSGTGSSSSIITGNRCFDDGTGTQIFGIRIFAEDDYLIIGLNDCTGSQAPSTSPVAPGTA